MDNECCGSQLYHTGVCCNDELIVAELADKILSAQEEKPLKNCACKGLGPCQCSSEEKTDQSLSDQFKDMLYVGSGCACGGNCGCN